MRNSTQGAENEDELLEEDDAACDESPLAAQDEYVVFHELVTGANGQWFSSMAGAWPPALKTALQQAVAHGAQKRAAAGAGAGF